METVNAKIEKTMLGVGDHGIMSCYLYLDYGGSGQGFGGYALDTSERDKNGKHLGRIGTASGMEFIMQILKTLNLEKWEDLPGTVCRVQQDWNKVHAIGHFLKDQWFNPEQFFAKEKEKLENKILSV